MAGVCAFCRTDKRVTVGYQPRRSSMTPKHSGKIVRGQARTLDAKAGDTLRVMHGRLWLTQSGSTTDHFLTAGEDLCLGLGKVVIEGDSQEAAGYEVRSPEAAATARRQSANNSGTIPPMNPIQKPAVCYALQPAGVRATTGSLTSERPLHENIVWHPESAHCGRGAWLAG